VVLVALILVAGCGASHSGTPPVAIVAGRPISWSDYQQYLDYSLRFYASAYHSPGRSSTRSCQPFDNRPPCSTLGRQLLASLIHERVVLSYASRHHIRLSSGDTRRIDSELAAMEGGTGNHLPIAGMHLRRSFLWNLLARELLVERVERAVVAGRASAGPSFHVRKYILPRLPDHGAVPVFKEALDLATDGRPIPAGTGVRDEWVAAFRLTGREQEALSAAQAGQFAGPFPGPRAYLVMQLLGAGRHTYGLPARRVLEAKYFHAWLQTAVRQADPSCFSGSGKRVVCP